MQLGAELLATPEPNCRTAWYALYARHQHEKTASKVLSGKGFNVFLPLCAVSRRWKDRSKELSVPLFPCYIFLRGGVERRLDILTTPGIHSLVESGGRPAPIPESEIDAIRRALEKSRVEPHPFLKCGDWVRVKSGPLEGIEGILVRKKNAFRLVLSVELLEKSLAVELDASIVERIATPATRRITVEVPTGSWPSFSRAQFNDQVRANARGTRS